MNPTPPPLAPKKRGCFFYGCIISLVLALLIISGAFMTGCYVMKTMRKMVTDYTQTSPAQLPTVEIPPAELKQLQERVAAFDSAVKAHTNTPPLVLTAREINALIGDNPQFKGKCYIELDGEKIKGQISLPLNDVADLPGFKMLNLKGRYLNGGATFKAAINNGDLSVFVESLEANGKSAPENIMTAFRQQNLADSFNKNQNPKPFEQYESLEVQDSTIIIKAKAQ